MPVWIPVAIGSSCVAVFVCYLATPNEQDRAVLHLPTPRSSLPLLHNTLDLMVKQRTRIYDWLFEQCREHQGGPWRVRVLGRPPAIVVSCPEAFKDVLKTQFDLFVKGPMITAIVSDVLGHGIFGVDGELWSHQRKTSSHLFTAHMIRDAMQDVVRDHSMVLGIKLRGAAANGDTVNVKRLLDFFTMDVFVKIGFGVDLGGLESDGESEFMDAFERASRRVVQRFQQPMVVWKLLRWLNVGAERQHAKDMELLNEFVYTVIARSVQEKTKATADVSSCPVHSKKNLISLFLDKAGVVYSDGHQAPMDPRLIRDMTLNFLFAGRDTTSLSMSWFIIMMNRHPAVLQRIRREIAEKLPDLMRDEVFAPTMGDVEHLVYLEAAIRESMRLNPVVAATTRIATQDTTLFDGTFIRAGTRIILPHYAMARMQSVWGDDAEFYNPDRWIDPSTGKLIQVSPYKFSVFLAGPRMCLGMKFALIEMKIALSMLLSKFELKTVRDPATISYRPSMTMQIDGPLDVVVSPYKFVL